MILSLWNSCLLSVRLFSLHYRYFSPSFYPERTTKRLELMTKETQRPAPFQHTGGFPIGSRSSLSNFCNVLIGPYSNMFLKQLSLYTAKVFRAALA